MNRLRWLLLAAVLLLLTLWLQPAIAGYSSIGAAPRAACGPWIVSATAQGLNLGALQPWTADRNCR